MILHLGVMGTMAAVKASAVADRINALGHCLGETLLDIVAAALGCPRTRPSCRCADSVIAGLSEFLSSRG